jgi:PAS domain S-box-containing protein
VPFSKALFDYFISNLQRKPIKLSEQAVTGHRRPNVSCGKELLTIGPRHHAVTGRQCFQKKGILTLEKEVGTYRDENLRLRKELDALRHEKMEMQIRTAQFLGLSAFSTDHIFMMDSSGTYQFSNDRVGQFGFTKGEELVGRRLQDVYQRNVLVLYRERLNEVLRNGSAVSFYHRKQTPDGEEYHIDTLYPVHLKGELWAIGGICCNISEQKRMENQLFQSQKMEALGTLVAGVAHEINNPINLILFNLPLLEKMWHDLMPVLESHIINSPEKKLGGLMPSFVKENLPRLISDMEMAANRVARIVMGLKGFASKSNQAEKRDIDANKAVNNAVRLAASTIKTSKTVMEMDLASDLPSLHANLQNLEQIVLNLIINALESIKHDHGKVYITTRFIEKDKSIIIEVSDNGRGVNPQVAEKIFDPFVTDRQTAGGTGLGLSVTYNLVKAHDGDISFKTKPGKGTTFVIALPTGPKQKPYKIMVVDDDSDFREMIVRALIRNTDCIIEDFANGAEALIRMGSYPPDLLILDMFMPEMDGLGVCRAIKNELGLDLMSVIIVTGFPDHPNLYEAACMGFGQILTKPLAIEEFIRIVKENLHGKTIDQFSHPNR